jgi:hypothetical protein
MSKAPELQKLLQIQKTYLSNINQQLLKPEYQNDAMKKLKVEVDSYVQSIQVQLTLAEHDLKMAVIKFLVNISAY